MRNQYQRYSKNPMYLEIKCPLLNNGCIKEAIIRKIRKYFQQTNNEKRICQNLLHSTEATECTQHFFQRNHQIFLLRVLVLRSLDYFLFCSLSPSSETPGILLSNLSFLNYLFILVDSVCLCSKQHYGFLNIYLKMQRPQFIR